MYEGKVNRNFTVEYDGQSMELKFGKTYIFPDHIGTRLTSQPITLKYFYNSKEPPSMPNYSNSRVLVSRTGGIGDIFFIIRSIVEIKKRFENVFVEFHTLPKYISILRNLFYPHIVSEIGNIFISYSSYEQCNYMVTFEGIIEGKSKEASNVNAFILISRKFQIDINNYHTIPLRIPIKYYEQAEQLSREWDTEKIIGLQLRASALIRTYPVPEQIRLIEILGGMGYKILLLDEKSTIEHYLNFMFPHYLHSNLLLPFSHSIPPSFELACALITKCSVVIAPDSVFVYVGDALNVPTIGIYTPFASHLRASGLNIYALEVKQGCTNCALHTDAPCRWSSDIWSSCLKKIKAEIVVDVVKRIIG